MKDIEYGKKYLLGFYNCRSEGIYLGGSRRKKKHFFLVKHNYSDPENVVLVAFKYFSIKNKYNIGEGSYETHDIKIIESFEVFHPKINKLEEEYLKELGKKYWGKDL